MTSRKKIFIFAGEISADRYGANLIKALYQFDSSLFLYGVGGPKMRALSFSSIVPMEAFQVMGFIDVFLALPRLLFQFFRLRRRILIDQPDAVLFIDYPGFNLALAKSLAKSSFRGKICHFICPSVWAWGKKRIPKMEKILDHLFVIFPFEAALFNSKKLSVHYVGHPLFHALKKSHASPLNIDNSKKIISLFPGSREKEIVLNFPLYVRVAKRLLEKEQELIFAISVAHPRFSPLIETILKQEKFVQRDRVLLLPPSENEALMKGAFIAIAKSGTNNLELALHKVPTVVTYGVKTLDLWIVKYILRLNLPYYSIVNILAGEQVYKELMGPMFTEERLFTEVSALLEEERLREKCGEKCEEVTKMLQGHSSHSPEQEVATILGKLLHS